MYAYVYMNTYASLCVCIVCVQNSTKLNEFPNLGINHNSRVMIISIIIIII